MSNRRQCRPCCRDGLWSSQVCEIMTNEIMWFGVWKELAQFREAKLATSMRYYHSSLTTVAKMTIDKCDDGINVSGEFIFVTLKFKFVNELSDSTMTVTEIMMHLIKSPPAHHHQPRRIQPAERQWWLVLEMHCHLPSLSKFFLMFILFYSIVYRLWMANHLPCDGTSNRHQNDNNDGRSCMPSPKYVNVGVF